MGRISKVLRTFYIAYVRAKLASGSKLYSTASAFDLKKSGVIQNSCLRLIFGALKSSPILCLQARAYLPSLELHRGMLSVNYLIILRYKPENKSISQSILWLSRVMEQAAWYYSKENKLQNIIRCSTLEGM